MTENKSLSQPAPPQEGDIVLEPQELTAILGMVDGLVEDKPVWEEDGHKTATLLLTDDDKNEHYIVRTFDSPGEVLTIAVPGAEEAYLIINADGTTHLEDTANEDRDDLPDISFTYLKDYLDELAIKNEAEKVHDEEVRQAASIESPPAFGELTEIDEETAARILRDTQFNDVPFRGQALDAELVENVGLTPKHKQQVAQDLVCYFSDIYHVNQRPAVLAFTDYDGKITPRTFYVSRSQGVWRYLPGYEDEEDGSMLLHKGKGEDSLNLPIALQKSLAIIGEKAGDAMIVPPSGIAKTVFYGTTAGKPDEAEISHFDAVNATGSKYGGAYIGLKAVRDDEYAEFKGPGDIKLRDDLAAKNPDFSKVSDSWELHNDLYWKIRSTVVPSEDGQWNYLFCTDHEGRSWIGQIEVADSPIRPTTLQSHYVSAGAIAAPAYEYATQAGDYGDGVPRGRYIDVYKNFLSKTPLISAFTASPAFPSEES